MSSLREIVKAEVLPRLLDDVRDCAIFNEADMQACTAKHLARHGDPNILVRNQPSFPVGQGRGKINAKPDIVVFNKSGPLAAFELKCFLDCSGAGLGALSQRLELDIEKLRRFQARYPSSSNAFSIAIVNLESRQDVEALQPDYQRWMSHYMFPYVVNVYCDDTGRKRRWYEDWRTRWVEWKRVCDGSPSLIVERRGRAA